jgi:hypothetical protein
VERILNVSKYAIYQLKDDHALRDYRFEPLDRLKAAGRSVDWGNYNHVYTGEVDSLKKLDVVELEKIYVQFNTRHPADFRGHSLSVSDVVVLHTEERSTAYYVDRIGNVEVPEFLEGPYKYYSTQRPIDIGTLPRTEHAPARIVNFDERIWREDATFKAWGYAAYNAPLTQKQISDYELRAASDNPDRLQIAPIQYAAQVEVVGKWEQSRRTNDFKRLTWFIGDYGTFVAKSLVSRDQIAERFGSIVEAKERAAEKRITKKPIAEQLAEAGKQAERENKAAPAKKQSNKSHEDR